MAIDSRAKRMSAILIGKPFRGAMVHAPDTGFGQAERQASAFMYSGILAGELQPAHFWRFPSKTAVFDIDGTKTLTFDGAL